jgi:hypothetical protein
MSEIIITADVVTGRIEVATGHWADDDRRWNAIRTPEGGIADAITVEPWGEDEESMDRATQAVRVLGYTVTRWNEPGAVAAQAEAEAGYPSSGEVKFARVTGRASYTPQELRIIDRAARGMGTSTYQPAEEDLEAAQALMDLGLLEKEPGFDTLTVTSDGHAAHVNA